MTGIVGARLGEMAYNVDPLLVPAKNARADFVLGKWCNCFLEDAGSSTEVEHLGLDAPFAMLLWLDNILEQG